MKNALFGYFWARISKDYCHICNQLPRICVIAQFLRKTRMSEFGTKNALFGYFFIKNALFENFLARILKKFFSYLKLAPSNLPNCKIL